MLCPLLTTSGESPRTDDIYQVNGAWKETETRIGLRWFYLNVNIQEKLLGTRNLRRGISPLQTELHALIWAMHCMLRHNKLITRFKTDCSDVVKMVSTPQKWPAFAILLDEVNRCKRRFTFFSIAHIPRTKNTKADKLAQSARALPTDMYYVTLFRQFGFPSWFRNRGC
ncbi:unnamed protein product [Microthlaspi erraticum]|uniref:RNase H type-1 domain-containing protein n=1 Tax=Microthlaspi erraticum TaxID=1685480 RepID=A0A6D2LJE4_9BRAS|nr:unnamed protein product [Microthlaspi erraticum]